MILSNDVSRKVLVLDFCKVVEVSMHITVDPYLDRCLWYFPSQIIKSLCQYF